MAGKAQAMDVETKSKVAGVGAVGLVAPLPAACSPNMCRFNPEGATWPTGNGLESDSSCTRPARSRLATNEAWIDFGHQF